MNERLIYVLCNPLESKEEQMTVLESLPLKNTDRVKMISEYDFNQIHGVETVRVHRFFAKHPLLRGFFLPVTFYFDRTRHSFRHKIFFIHDEIFTTTMIHAALAKVFLRCRVIVLCMENIRFSWLHKLAGLFFARFVDCALCPNQEAIQYVRSLRVRHVFPCALPVLDSEQKVKLVSGIKRIGFVGRLVPQKGLIYFCEAAREIPECEFKVFGRGRLIGELQKYPVQYSGDYLYTSRDLDRVFSEIDLLILPSITTKTWSEQFGRVLTEAMDRGVLVIGSNSGAIPQVIGSGDLIFEEGSAHAIVKKILELRERPQKALTELATGLKNRFDEHYSKHTIRKQIQKSIDTISIKT